MTEPRQHHPDGDARKGSVESDQPADRGNNSPARGSNQSMAGQLGHRDPEAMLKDNDTDFPEPDATGEHSGPATSGKAR